MKLIVGLGNVGQEFQSTRHNVGFMVADNLAAQQRLTFAKQGSVYKDMELAKGSGFLLLKPHTMMNLSGRAVQAAAHYYKVDISDIWAVHDDFDLEFGKLRLRQGGSSGGHNGLKSIIEALGPNFGRIRVGIRNLQFNNPIPAIDFVLQRFNTTEMELLPRIITQTASIILDHLADGELKDTTFNLLSAPADPKRTTSAGGVVLNSSGEILVVNQNGDSWSLPKGHLDPGETPEAAARREVKEESGLSNLRLIQPLGQYQRPQIGLDGKDNLSELKTIIMFLFKADQTKLQPLDPHNPEARWVKPEEVPDLLTHSKDQDFFRSIMPKIRA